MRIVVVSDTHLSPRAPEAERNWDSVVAHVAATRPDCVIHLGDLSLDGAIDPADLRHARRQLERLAVPWHVIPGNHDIGDNPSPGTHEAAIDDERRARWLDIIGFDHFALGIPGWSLVAINAQLFGSGLAAEAQQWTWLDDQLGAARARVALLSHKPLTAPAAELAEAPHDRFVSPDARRRLLSGHRTFSLVASGHVHQSRRLEIDGTYHLWAPTTWAVLPERIQPTIGVKRSGVMALTLLPDGPVQADDIVPDGLLQLTLGVDFPVPYHR